MRTPWFCLLFSLPALAQSIEMSLEPFGARIDVRPPEPPHHIVTEEVNGDGYRLTYRTADDGETSLEILEPEGAHIEVWDGSQQLVSDEIPTSFHPTPNRWYRVVVTSPGGHVWERKVQAKSGMRASLWISPLPKKIIRRRPAHAIEPGAMPDGDFERLKAAIEAEGFSDQKLDVLRTASRSAWFTVQQVGELIELFSFGEDKVRVVEATAARLVDRHNAFRLYERFTFSEDKEKVKAILERY